MMPLTSVTVESFFRKANWQGLKIIHDDANALTEAVVVEEATSNLHFGLTVEKFFALHNWQGIVKTHQELLPPTQQSTYTLTMPVGEFFRRILWQGQNQGTTKKANIASMPKMSSVVNITPQSLNVKDLSDLL